MTGGKGQNKVDTPGSGLDPDKGEESNTGNTVNNQSLSDPENSKSGDDKEIDPVKVTGELDGRILRSAGQRKLTERGIAYQIELNLKKFQRTVYNWRSAANRLEMSMNSDSPSLLQDMQVEFDTRLQAVSSAYENYVKFLAENERENDQQDCFDEIVVKHEKLMSDIGAQVQVLFKQLQVDAGSRGSSRSRSGMSRSSRRSRHSASSNAAAQAARLRAKLRHIDIEAEQKLELEKAKLKLEKIQTVKELDMAEAEAEEFIGYKENVSVNSRKICGAPKDYIEKYLQTQQNFNDELQNNGGQYNSKLEGRFSEPPLAKPQMITEVKGNPQLNVDAKDFVPCNEPLQTEKMYNFALQTIDMNRLPAPEPEIFFGDPLKFPEWKCAFGILIERRNIPQEEKLYYLKRYLGGEARDVVSGLFFLQNEEVYEKAKRRLEERFGDPFVIADAFRNKIESWPRIQSRDSIGLRRFADFLRQCDIAMESVSSLKFLNDDRENRKLLQKCPEWIVNRWARSVSDFKMYIGSFPSFKDFVDFLEKEARIACDPVISATQFGSTFSKAGQRRQANANVLATEASVDASKPEVFRPKPLREIVCAFCGASHYIDLCKDFLRKSIEERKQFVKEKGLCFGCLYSGHKSVKCKWRKTCRDCGRRHPTSLHGDITRPTQAGVAEESNTSTTVNRQQDSGDAVPVSSFFNNTGSSHKCSMILPVWVHHVHNPAVSKVVYALLDSQSDTTFVLERTCRDLGISGTEVDLSLSTMFAENCMVRSNRIDGLVVRGYRESKEIHLPPTYTRSIMPANKSHIPTADIAVKWPHLRVLKDKLEPLMGCEIGLLIGYNCPRALVPRNVLVSEDDQGPYGQQSDLGWGIVGLTDIAYIEDENDVIGVSHRILAKEVQETQKCNGRALFLCKKRVKEIITPSIVAHMFEQDFNDRSSSDLALSQEDRLFMKILRDGIRKTDDKHYELPLPFRHHDIQLPNSRPLAVNRLDQLRRRLLRCSKLHKDYTQFMDRILSSGYAERVTDSGDSITEGTIWYIPHHGVYQPSKPDKIRVVFDASATFMGRSLNKELLQGPDMTNSLVGVLCRFREEVVAFTCDIQQMFYQFKVTPRHRDFLRFLWWEDGNLDKDPVDYRMTVHMFGATSSPGCANFCIKRIAEEARESHPQASSFLERNFYVDDGIISVPCKTQAMHLVHETKSVCAAYGLHLHKFVSNVTEILQRIPPHDCSERRSQVQLEQGDNCLERALGVEWCVDSDTLHFRITLKDRPCTRRGILATLCSLYDPLGFAAPVILRGKTILQEICRDQASWDDPLSADIRVKWEKWRSEIILLSSVQVPRCFKPKEFGRVVKTELHHFSDASCLGYGQCSYVRFQNDKGDVHCSFVIGKGRVAPIKTFTIPRLELVAALVSVKMSQMLVKELQYAEISETFWCDSQVVLGYINNDARRFNVFVANRVQQIRDHTEPSQWKYVSSKNNPADEASRGLLAKELSTSKWLTGPEFLWQNEIPDFGGVSLSLSEEDPEVKVRSTVLATNVNKIVGPLDFSYFSSWTKLRRAMALCLKYMEFLRGRVVGHVVDLKLGISHTVTELVQAEQKVIRLVQREAFQNEISMILSNSQDVCDGGKPGHVKKSSPIYRLNPFIDNDGLLRVGGRLKQGDIPFELKHPVIIPKNHHLTDLLVKHCHESIQHQGRGMTLNKIRSSGYWIIACTSVVYRILSSCITCRRMYRCTEEQKMADLPVDRMMTSPPFTYVGSDYFGPFIVKEGRKELKRYGVLFTCMASRAIHLEVASSLTTDSFINALRRFIAIRGPVRQLRSDQGTNYIGAANELKKALNEMDHHKINNFLLDNNCDYIKFKTNVPHASHQGGVWERQIRTVRRVLSALLQEHGSQLCDESLRTFLCEVSSIVNSRPLTVDNLNDPCSTQPLSPNVILTMKTSVVLPPPGEFSKVDLYCKARWRRVQYLANVFWSRWRKEYLMSVQVRNKWNVSRPNLQVGNIVILKDDSLPRNSWKLARVVEVHQGDDGYVRTVKLAVAQTNLDSQGRRTQPVTYLERPVQKLVLLVGSDDGTPLVEP